MKNTTKGRLHFIACVCAAVLLSGCASIETVAITNTYRHPKFDKIKVHDIGYLTFTNDSVSKKDISSQVTAEFVKEFDKRGWYVFHPLQPQDLTSPEKTARIDAILTGSILEYRDYEPFKFGLKVQLKELDTNETIWSAQEVFDAGRQEVVKSVRYYYETYIEQKYPMMGYKIYLISMDKFVEYSANRLIDTLQEMNTDTVK